MSELEIKEVECPYCAEKISHKAKKCKHCGEIVDHQMREIEFLKQQRNNSHLVVNNNNNNNNPQMPFIIKRNYPWIGHLFLTLLTGGFWLIFWIILYLLRDKNQYN